MPDSGRTYDDAMREWQEDWDRTYEGALREKAKRIGLIRELLNDQSISDDEIWSFAKALAKERGAVAPFDVTRALNERNAS